LGYAAVMQQRKEEIAEVEQWMDWMDLDGIDASKQSINPLTIH